MNKIIEEKGKAFIYRAVKVSDNAYIILRGKNINGEFVEYSNMFASPEDRKAKHFKNEKEAEKYIKALAMLEKAAE